MEDREKYSLRADGLDGEYIKANEEQLKALNDFIPWSIRSWFKDYAIDIKDTFVGKLYSRSKVRMNKYSFDTNYMEIYEFLMRHVQFIPILKDEDKFLESIGLIEEQFNVNFNELLEKEEEYLFDKYRMVFDYGAETWEKVD